MHTMAADDTEITLGVGKLLGLFFLLAAICGVFFSIGYSLGKNFRPRAGAERPAGNHRGLPLPNSGQQREQTVRRHLGEGRGYARYRQRRHPDAET